MNFSVETMLQLSILLPIVSTAGVVAAGKMPNLREAVSIGTGLVLFYFVTRLYQALEQEQTISVQWGQIVPGLHLSFSVEPLGMLFALVASFLWIVTTVYAIGYMRGHNEENQTRFYACLRSPSAVRWESLSRITCLRCLFFTRY